MIVTLAKNVLALIFLGFVALVIFVSCSVSNMDSYSSSAESFTSNILDEVANDAVKEYEIANRQGDKMMICVQAGMVAAAYLQAQNEPKYNEWMAIEKSDCRRAGLDDDY